ncbi:GspH/FimT family pseudopilin [Variovorax saccharolyticus]|uniref:GspH/FimT family pseudopilin n=1 Tax=Variovorax saccharolyticus TaxID=3053516 RepID=UPI002574DE12|nr:GspH/FimT family pseudopilin [Variovorax sp. J31P216]MDM0023310.1 GspH/FimT family pseudopilin [Variovorax sp. J31P216]
MPESAPLSRFAPVSPLSGFTLVEVLAVLAIVAVLAGLAMPGFGRTLERYRLRAAEEGLRSALYTARSEAIRRGGGVTLRRASGGGCTPASEQDWSCGWTLFADTDGNGRHDPGEALIQAWPAPRGVQATVSVAAPSTYLNLNRSGRFHNLGAFRFTLRPERSSDDKAARVMCMSSAGRLQTLQGTDRC